MTILLLSSHSFVSDIIAPTSVFVSLSTVSPQSVSSLDDFRTDRASVTAWLMLPLFRNSSSRLPFPITKFCNFLATSDIGERQGSNLEDGFTCIKSNGVMNWLHLVTA